MVGSAVSGWPSALWVEGRGSLIGRDPAFLRMFRHEVAAARRVVGFCTARVLDADVSGPLPYLVTEYVEGVRLDRAVAEAGGGLSPTDLEGLDGRLRELVEACMAKRPEERPTARDVLLDLLGEHATPDPQAGATRLLQRTWSSPVTETQGSPAPAPTASAQARPRQRGRRIVAVGLLAAALVAAGLVAVRTGLVRSPTAPPPGATIAVPATTSSTAVKSPPQPLCELLGDLGVGDLHGSQRADQVFASAPFPNHDPGELSPVGDIPGVPGGGSVRA